MFEGSKTSIFPQELTEREASLTASFFLLDSAVNLMMTVKFHFICYLLLLDVLTEGKESGTFAGTSITFTTNTVSRAEINHVNMTRDNTQSPRDVRGNCRHLIILSTSNVYHKKIHNSLHQTMLPPIFITHHFLQMQIF